MSPSPSHDALTWVPAMLRLKPARLPIGHSLRSGITVGAPFVIGVLTGHVLIGMWIGLATLLLSAGEREGSHRLNLRILLISTPIAASAYLLGFIQHLPTAWLVLVMAALAFGSGIISGYGAAFSVGGMQFLLVAAIAIGVPGIDNWWQPIGWYVVGAAFYAALMAADFALERRRPQRQSITALLRALSALAAARSDDLTDGSNATPVARAAAISSLGNARTVYLTGRGSAAGHAPEWDAFARTLSAAESVIALLVGTTAAKAAGEATIRLEALTSGKTAGIERSLSPSPLMHRLDELTQALAGMHLGLALPPVPMPQRLPDGGAAPSRSLSPRESLRSRLVVGPDVVAAAGRLALCYGIAVAAREYDPSNHWFWVPLTVALVMKPDFGSVIGRALLRIVGTIGGAALATVVIAVVPKGVGTAIVIGLLAAAVPWAMLRGYAMQAVAISSAVILLVDVIEPGAGSTNYSAQRIAATAIGGLIVVVFGYLLWPSARRANITGRLASSTEALARYAAAAATAIPSDPAQRDTRHEELVRARLAVYSSLSDVRLQLQRGLSEPPPANVQARSWIPAVAALEQLSDAVSRYAASRLAGERVAEVSDGVVKEIAGLGTVPDPEQIRTSSERVTRTLLAPI